MMDAASRTISTVEAWREALSEVHYIPSQSVVQMLHLAIQLGRPLLIEGPAGSGKTSLAQALSRVLQREFVRLQCFEGIDAANALYDWNYHKQFAALTAASDTDVFDESYLLARPLLKALQAPEGAVLLIDEVDRADEAMEALLLEYLGEWQITVPEWKTVRATVQPITILTSNRTRPLSDALRRRCLYIHLPYPDVEHEERVVETHVPTLAAEDRHRLIEAIHVLRTWPLVKSPGLAESIDWCKAYDVSGGQWTAEWVTSSLGCVLKDELDMAFVTERLNEWMSGFT